jgi:DedD protein
VKPDAVTSPLSAGDGAKSVANASSAAQGESTSAPDERAKAAIKRAEAEPKQKAIQRLEDHKPPPKESKASPKDTSASSAAYIVQVAALSDAARVKQLRKQIAGAGVKSYVEVVSTKSGDVTRIRAGPYSTREAAEKARTQLKKLGLDGKVVPK